MSDVKIWYSPGACSLAAHILLKEIGLNFEANCINVRKGFPKEALHLNAKGRVPILSVNGEMITELPAILTAISQLSPEKHLMGRNQIETVRVYEWMNWLSGTVHGQGFVGFLRPARYSDDKGVYQSIKAKAVKNLQGNFDEIECKLKSTFAVGDDFTGVDAFLFVLFRWAAGMLKFDMEGKYPRLTALAANVAERKSTQAALEAEGITPLIPSKL